jgi:knotted carbamoyltransferase YgeW
MSHHTPQHQIQALIEKIGALKNEMFEKDFLLTWERSQDEIEAIRLTAYALELMYYANISTRAFDGGLAVCNFRDKSTRTRFSFASAASMLGLSLQDIDETKIQVSHGETVRETANMISFLTEVYGIRDDLFIGEGHEYMKEVGDSIDDGYKAGCLPQRTTVVNLQCDRDHPTQSMCDLLHLQKTFGSVEALKGKKIAMTWGYSPSYGKPLSVAQSIITMMTRYGMDVVLAHPEGYDLMPGMHDIAKKHAAQSGGSFSFVHSMEEAFKGADVVYPKSWAPFHIMQERTKIVRAGENKKLEALEKEALEENAKHKSWECTETLMKLTKGGKAHYMHPLPADITDVNCKAGEVSKAVFEQYRYETYHEAEHKLYAIAAMILNTRFKSAPAVLRTMLDQNRPRRMG